MLSSRWRAIALGGACAIVVAPLARGEPPRRPQVRDTLSHVLDTMAGGVFRFESGLRTRARLVVRDSVTWDSLWTRVTANRIFRTDGDSLRPVRFPLPAIDFSRDMLIVVSGGELPSVQYGTRIERVRMSRRELRVDVCSWHPSRDMAQFWAIPTPLDIVRVARTALAVRFVDHSTVNSFDRPASPFARCLRGARRPMRKNAGRSARKGNQ